MALVQSCLDIYGELSCSYHWEFFCECVCIAVAVVLFSDHFRFPPRTFHSSGSPVVVDLVAAFAVQTGTFVP